MPERIHLCVSNRYKQTSFTNSVLKKNFEKVSIQLFLSVKSSVAFIFFSLANHYVQLGVLISNIRCYTFGCIKAIIPKSFLLCQLFHADEKLQAFALQASVLEMIISMRLVGRNFVEEVSIQISQNVNSSLVF